MPYLIDPKTGRRIMMPTDGIMDPRTRRPILLSRAVPGLSNAEREADLMSRLPDADLAGAIGPGVVPGGEQVKWARQAALRQEALPPPPETYRPLGGASQNNRGGAVTIRVGGSNGTPAQEIANIVQTPRSCGDDAEDLTIVLGTEFNDLNAFASNDFAPRAVIKWGIGGASFSALVDWLNGTIFTVPASFLSLGARVFEADAGPDEFIVTLSAGISYGGSYGKLASPARLSVPAGNLIPGVAPWKTELAAGATGPDIPIPNFARSFTIVDGSGGVPSLRASIQGASSSNVSTFTTVVRTNLGNQHDQQFPIVNGAILMNIDNFGAALSSNPFVIFSLAF